MAPYQYSPLGDDEIRLLTLSSRRSGSLRIGVEIKKLSSSDRPRYEALSYVWGSSESPCTIAVEDIHNSDGLQRPPETLRPRLGGSHNRNDFKISKKARSAAMSRQAPRTLRSTISLAVTRNLAEALPYLQMECAKRILWIDAICINQEDLAERGQQVGRMADIYKMARRVVIWLGPADRYSKLALMTVANLAAQVEVNFVTQAVKTVRDANPLLWETMHTLPFDNVIWRSLNSLFQRSWFERLWIWQEVHVNSHDKVVMIGQYSLPWTTIRKFVINLYSTQICMPHEVSHSLGRAYLLSRDAVIDNLINVLLATRHAKCADARDRIFAVLGLLEPRNRLEIHPDYTKTVADVFGGVVLHYLAVVNRLDVLQLCELTAKVVGMASWVPDWSNVSETVPTYPRASLSADAEAEYDGKRTLGVSGVEVGAVASVQPQECLTRGESSWADFFSSIFSLLPASDKVDLSGIGPEIEIAMRSLCRHTLAEQFEPPRSEYPSTENVMQSLLRWHKYLAKEKLDSDFCEPPPISLCDETYRVHVQTLAALYSCFRTMEGLIGLGPKSMVPGDKVCVVLGCDAPLILRPTTEDEWMIVGDCYVHGIMDGSALLSSCPSDFRLIERMNPQTGFYCMAFRNIRTGHIQIEDPRIIKPLPAGWEVLKHRDEQYEQLYVNKDQNRCTVNDPRLSPDALRARGVKLRTFKLV